MRSYFLVCLLGIAMILGCSADKNSFSYYNQTQNQEADTCSATVTTADLARPDYIIVTRQKFFQALQPLIVEKSKNYEVRSFLLEDILSATSPLDIQEQMRTWLAGIHTDNQPGFLLIVGSPNPNKSGTGSFTLDQDWEIPIRYLTEPNGSMGNEAVPSDQYYASLHQPWDSGSAWIRTFDFVADLYVGRIPAKEVNEVTAWVQKNLGWHVPTYPVHSNFLDAACSYPDFTFEVDAPNDFLAQNTHHINLHRCTQDAGGSIAALSKIDGADYVTSYSHGNNLAILSIGSSGNGYWLDSKDLDFGKPVFQYAHACSTTCIDCADGSIAQQSLFATNGAVAYLGYTRNNTDMVFPFWESVFVQGNLMAGQALYSEKQRRYHAKQPAPAEVSNWFKLNLLGDPSLVLANPTIAVTSQSAKITDSGQAKSDVCLQIASKVPADGWLESTPALDNGRYIPIQAGTQVELVTIPVTAGPYPMSHSVNIGLTEGCSPNHNSCLATSIDIVPPLDFSCAWLERSGDGQFSFLAKFNNAVSDPVEFRLSAAPGKFLPNGCPDDICSWDYSTLTTWTQTMQSPSLQEVRFDYTDSSDQNLNTEGSVYLSGTFKLDAFDADENNIGTCFVHFVDYKTVLE